MASQNLATIIGLLALFWTAIQAGAGYILGKQNKRIHRLAIGKTVFSILLMALLVYINWR